MRPRNLYVAEPDFPVKELEMVPRGLGQVPFIGNVDWPTVAASVIATIFVLNIWELTKRPA